MASQNTTLTESFVLGPNGSVATVPTVMLSDADAALLREYKKFLMRYHLREALYCNDCFAGEMSDGTEAQVTNSDIMIKCRCKLRLHQGQTF